MRTTVLFDDGTVVEHLRDVVCGGADQLDSPLKGLMVRLASNEGRKKGVVNVDQVFGAPGRDELVREYLHVARQHDETAAVFADKGDLLLLDFPFVLFCDRKDEVGNAIEVGDPLIVGMIGDDQRNLALQLAALMAVEQVLQAVVILGDEDGNARPVGGTGQPPVHLEVVGDGTKMLREPR